MEERKKCQQVTHIQISPVNEHGEVGGSYTEANSWIVMAIGADNTVETSYRATLEIPIDDCVEEAFRDHPEADMKVTMRSLENGEDQVIGPFEATEMIGELVPYILEDTSIDPPLEEIRSVLEIAKSRVQPGYF
ncbi:hypothetical protein [Salipiger sp. PrR003]|uniref:hypothetical protein n=1 Tax=Salipiger sp. PrR003 TaxID=2706776 RepID=UPI0013DBBAE1|nr:hypothetical protein [Salipiger sp. PrR003]NDV51527.1 hypothetical protein [Salipiger sp. PrR003]